MSVLADAGVFGALQAPTPTSAGMQQQTNGFSLSGRGDASGSGTAVVMLVVLAILGVTYWQTRGLQH